MMGSRQWKIWVCPECPYIIEFNGNEEEMYCTGDGCGSIPIDWDTIPAEDTHKQAKMELVRVEEIE